MKEPCAVCGKELLQCDTIWTAEGSLYCSKECGIKDFEKEYGKNAEKLFNLIAEEIIVEEIL